MADVAIAIAPSNEGIDRKISNRGGVGADFGDGG